MYNTTVYENYAVSMLKYEYVKSHPTHTLCPRLGSALSRTARNQGKLKITLTKFAKPFGRSNNEDTWY